MQTDTHAPCKKLRIAVQKRASERLAAAVAHHHRADALRCSGALGVVAAVRRRHIDGVDDGAIRGEERPLLHELAVHVARRAAPSLVIVTTAGAPHPLERRERAAAGANAPQAAVDARFVEAAAVEAVRAA